MQQIQLVLKLVLWSKHEHESTEQTASVFDHKIVARFQLFSFTFRSKKFQSGLIFINVAQFYVSADFTAPQQRNLRTSEKGKRKKKKKD